MAAFTTRQVNYHEDRTDGGYAWDVRYGLSFLNSEFNTSLKIKLTGADPGSTAAVWENGANAIWNQRAFLTDGTRLYEIKINVDFVSSGQHQTVLVHEGTGRADMTNWYLQDPWGPSKYDEVAAHEVGHMLGNYDEYQGGATNSGRVFTNTLMSDLTQGGFNRYFWTIDYFAGSFGNTNFTTVMALRGSNGADTMTGVAGMDGMYGFGGNDLLLGRGGNDFLDAGSGNDTIRGGSGRDIMVGGRGYDNLYGESGADTFDFNSIYDSARGGSRDVIRDFSRAAHDRIDLSSIDADVDFAPGNQAFRFIGGGGFHGVDGELRFAGGVLQGDVNGDRIADFEIRVFGGGLASSDFIL